MDSVFVYDHGCYDLDRELKFKEKLNCIMEGFGVYYCWIYSRSLIAKIAIKLFVEKRGCL